MDSTRNSIIAPNEPMEPTPYYDRDIEHFNYIYDPLDFSEPEKVKVCNKKRVSKEDKKRKKKLSQKSRVINRK